jgi:protein-L-isoaspartate(D-aspartate) O-methyltransferase
MVDRNRPLSDDLHLPGAPDRTLPGTFGQDEADRHSEHVKRREKMVKRTVAARGISDARVLGAMRAVPRELFVPAELSASAYDDRPLPIGDGQTISQPYIVALMAGAADPSPGSRVLEIGTGSGYGAAVLAGLAGKVHTVERNASLAADAAQRLEELGYTNVRVHCADGSQGWPPAAPYDAVVVTAAPDRLPEDLVPQLTDGGRLVVPIGPQGGPQRLWCCTRRGDRLETEDLGGVAFVPLVSDGAGS